MRKIFLVSIAILLFLPNLFNTDINDQLLYNRKEEFDPKLTYINSIDKLKLHVDSIASQKNIAPAGYEYVALLENIISQRFYHGFSHFTLSEDWIAAVAGKFLKEDYACKVQPEKIIQHANAACSQQSLVMMAVLREKNISYRAVGFPHHYAMEVAIGNNWYYFDANMEPVMNRYQREETNWKLQNDSLKKYYDTGKHENLNYQFGNGLTATTGMINEVPAGNARIFYTVTGFLSKICWLFPILLLYYRPRFSFNKPVPVLNFKRKSPALSLAP